MWTCDAGWCPGPPVVAGAHRHPPEYSADKVLATQVRLYCSESSDRERLLTLRSGAVVFLECGRLCGSVVVADCCLLKVP